MRGGDVAAFGDIARAGGHTLGPAGEADATPLEAVVRVTAPV
jgi:hypothetical protein